MSIHLRGRAGRVALVALLLPATLAGCRIQPGAPQAGPSPAAPSPTAPAPVPPTGGQGGPSPTPTPPGGPAGTTHPPVPTADCQSGDLVLDSIDDGAAAGTRGEAVTVTNHRTTPCRLPAFPSLVYTDPAGATHPLPASTSSPEPPAMVVPPGGRAQFSILFVNGYGGYDPTAPECAHPVTYRNIAIKFGTGRLALTGLTLDIKCGGISLLGWAPPNAG